MQGKVPPATTRGGLFLRTRAATTQPGRLTPVRGHGQPGSGMALYQARDSARISWVVCAITRIRQSRQ